MGGGGGGHKSSQIIEGLEYIKEPKIHHLWVTKWPIIEEASILCTNCTGGWSFIK